MIEVTIPLNILKAIRLLAPKTDVRYYLEGVALVEGHAVATNGAYLGAYRWEGLDGAPEVIIPNKAIDVYVKKVGRSSATDTTVRWEEEPTTGGAGAPRYGWLTNGNQEEKFQVIDGRYPDFKRVLVHHTAPSGHPQFPWSQLALFEDVAVALGVGKKCPLKVFVVPNGPRGGARLRIYSYPDFEGVIMPLAWKDDAPFRVEEPATAEGLV